jgi:hypothetical protein
MPYVIIIRPETNAGPQNIGRICRARSTRMGAAHTSYKLIVEPSHATVLFTPGSIAAGAPTYDVISSATGAIAGLSEGPYSDVSAIKDAVESYTNETCLIRISA